MTVAESGDYGGRFDPETTGWLRAMRLKRFGKRGPRYVGPRSGVGREGGHPASGYDVAGDRTWVDAKEYLRPAFDQNIGKMAETVEREIGRVFDDTWPNTSATLRPEDVTEERGPVSAEAYFGGASGERFGVELETGKGVLKFYAGGLTDLASVMRKLGPRITAKLTKGALKTAAAPMLHTARALVPESPAGSHGRWPGFLREQLVFVSYTSTHFPGTYRVGVSTKGGGLYKGDAYYGAFVELGHFAGPRPGRKRKRR